MPQPSSSERTTSVPVDAHDVPLEVPNLRRDRYGTLRLMSWWDQDVVGSARVLVMGAGAIGNEVLGIQKVLQGAGDESRIYVETVDQRLADLTFDYRQLVTDSNANNILIHHFSIASRASRVAFALPERMILVYHNITPPKYFIGVKF